MKYTDFTDDKEKMIDFYKLTKDEFLKSYSYLTEEEYNLTEKAVRSKKEMSAIKHLWEAFGDIPIDNNDRILEPFCKFCKGTNRFDVWTWFEEEFNVSVAMDLMGLEGSEI